MIELRVKLNGATLKVWFVRALAHGEHETKGNFNRNRDVAAEREQGCLFLFVFNRLNILRVSCLYQDSLVFQHSCVVEKAF
jgi:hypothetical protein